MLTMFKDDNHSPDSIFRLACWLVYCPYSTKETEVNSGWMTAKLLENTEESRR